MFSKNLLYSFAIIIISTNYISSVFAKDDQNFQETENAGGRIHNKTFELLNGNQSVDGDASHGRKFEENNAQTIRTEQTDAISDQNEEKTYFLSGESKNDCRFKNAFENPSNESTKCKRQQKGVADSHKRNKEDDRTEIEMRQNVRVNRVGAQRFTTHENILKRILKESNGNNATEANGIVRTNERLDELSKHVEKLLMHDAQEIVDRVNSDPKRKWQAEIIPDFNEMDVEDLLRLAGRANFINKEKNGIIF